MLRVCEIIVVIFKKISVVLSLENLTEQLNEKYLNVADELL